MTSLKIGNVVLENNLILAPMAGVTDLPFRCLCRRQGAGLVCMEMVSAKAIKYNNKNTDALMNIDAQEKPASLQLFGNDPKIISEMARRIEEKDFAILDINMGCPVPKVFNNGEGSALMKEPELAAEIVRQTSKAIEKPVTVKFRLGIDDNSINCVDFAKRMEDAGAKAITVHARTREQYYSGAARWEYIRAVKEAVSIPVIGNGDVTDGISAAKLVNETNCDGIMIGRACQGNPWIFRDISDYLEKGIINEQRPVRELCEMMREHGRLMIECKGEYIGIREMRKHVAWYMTGRKNAAALRKEACQLESFEQYEEFLRRLEDEG